MDRNAPLPIDEALPPLIAALSGAGQAVLQAPPGAGKTTRVPLALLQAGLTPGRIVMLEPRRLAARAAAERMAATLGERPGETVGYRIRGESRVGPRTRIEVVTEGVLTRMLQSDPELSGVGAVLFDEFHERSLNADLGLALCLEVRGALREDLMLVVMSATLEAAPVAALMGDAPVITSEGRAYPVERRYLERPRPAGARLAPDMAGLIRDALGATSGSVLAFLPGAPEIRRTAALLNDLPGDVRVMELYGALPFARQQEAIRPLKEGRKVVLATSIAETSLTIEGITAVVDSGLARRAVFDPASGMTRLETMPASRAETRQRAGRAGRLSAGTAWRLWTRAQHGALPEQAPPEIALADLAGLALELAAWGSAPEDLPLLTLPNAGSFSAARRLLAMLGALDDQGRITAHGKLLAGMPLHPRLAHMLAVAGPAAAPLAALLSDRDPMPEAGTSLETRLRRLSQKGGPPALARIRDEARRLSALAPKGRAGLDAGEMTSLAYPDRIAQHRGGSAPRYLMTGGKGAILPEGDAMAGQPLLAVAELDGDKREARIRTAALLSQAGLQALHGGRIQTLRSCTWSRRENRVTAREEDRLDALVLASRPVTDMAPEAVLEAMLEGLRLNGLTPEPAAARLARRAELVRAAGHDLPDFSDAALVESASDWLAPYLDGVTTLAQLRALPLLPAFEARLGWEARQLIDREAPASYTTPLGRKLPIDYETGQPGISLRLQELFGVTRHPMAAGRPLRITLLSPAGRPLQVTTDLPGFWASSYADVRRDMRGRYPKHPWPEDPASAQPTMRAKPRK